VRIVAKVRRVLVVAIRIESRVIGIACSRDGHDAGDPDRITVGMIKKGKIALAHLFAQDVARLAITYTVSGH
jgi:hypothetical protein